MSRLESLIAQLEAGQASYVPNDEELAKLGSVTFIPIVGPASVGKNTVMDYVSEHDEAFARVVGFTTRTKRQGEPDGQYLFLPHDEPTLASLEDMRQQRVFAQYAVHPTTKRVYGSMAQEYARPYMMMDTLYNAIPAMQRLPFKNFVIVSLVCEPEVLEQRFAQRSDEAEKAKRWLEAEQSLAWSLEQGDAVAWVDNSQEGAATAAEAVIAAAHGERLSTDARSIGERLHKYISKRREQE